MTMQMSNDTNEVLTCDVDELDEGLKKEIIVSNEAKGKRIDAFLSEVEGITRSAAARFCEGFSSTCKKLAKS